MCEHSDEPCGSVKGGEFIRRLVDCHHKKDYFPLSVWSREYVELHVHFPIRGHGVVEHLKKAQFMLVMSVVQLQYVEDVLPNVGPATVPYRRSSHRTARK